MARALIANCIISNHTATGKFGINVDAGTAAANELFRGFIDYNYFYNNTGGGSGGDVGALNYGAHDTHGGSNPYNGQSTQDYSLNTANITLAMALPSAPFSQTLAGKATTVQTGLYQGAVQPKITGKVLSYSNGYPNAAFPQGTAGQTTVQSFLYPGAVQPGGAGQSSLANSSSLLVLLGV